MLSLIRTLRISRLTRWMFRLAFTLAGKQNLIIRYFSYRLSGTNHGGNRRRRTAIEALLQVYTTQALQWMLRQRKVIRRRRPTGSRRRRSPLLIVRKLNFIVGASSGRRLSGLQQRGR